MLRDLNLLAVILGNLAPTTCVMGVYPGSALLFIFRFSGVILLLVFNLTFGATCAATASSDFEAVSPNVCKIEVVPSPGLSDIAQGYPACVPGTYLCRYPS